MICLNFPIAYLIGLHREAGLPGLWIGFGIATTTLAVLYSIILAKLNWRKAAEKAAEDETDPNQGEVSQLHEYRSAIEL